MKLALFALALFSAFAFSQQPDSKPTIGVVPDPCAVLPSKAPAQEMLTLDFGNFCRYSAENSKLPPASDHRVVMMGDSITEFWSRLDPSLFTNDVINRGISGQTSPQMLVRFRADVLDLHPRVVHLLLGTNDIAGNTGPTTLKRIEDSIASMAELAHAEHITVLLGSVLPAHDFPWRPAIEPIDSITQLNLWLRDYAKAHRFVYVDYYSAMQDGAHGMRKELSEDGVHPNADGYEIMKKLLLPALAKAKK